MIVRNYHEANQSDRHVATDGGQSVRLLLKDGRHIPRAETEMTMACVINPPATGRKAHDETGAYPLAAEAF